MSLHLFFSVVQLHLNPIHAVVQLRPSMCHLDQKESKKKTAVRNNVEDVVKSEEHQEVKTSGISKKQVNIVSLIYLLVRLLIFTASLFFHLSSYFSCLVVYFNS